MKAIIFDCYGVLLGTGIWNVYRQLGGDPIKDADFIDDWISKAHMPGSDPAAMKQIMADRLGVDTETYKEASRKDQVLNRQLFDFISTNLKSSYKLAMVSNANSESLRRKIPEDKLSLFDVVLISEEVGLLKPDPRLFKLALEQLGSLPEETLFVDDHQEYLDGAKLVGIQSLLYTSFEDFKQKVLNLI
ncbi:MAG TPA: HAD-IA family hydrolase [Candidatus Saccharimonadales bacterium]